MEDVKSFFKRELEHINFDKKFYKRINAFRLIWGQKNQDYMDFLGGNSIGVQAIRFSERDRDDLLEDIYLIDISDVTLGLYNLEGIDKTYKVSSSLVNQILLYTVHTLVVDRSISKKDRVERIQELYYIFAYRTISSLIAWFFKSHNLDKSVANAVYERLTGRFILKKLGTWQEVFQYKSEDLTDEKGIHYEALKRYNTEDSVYILNDLQGKIRSMVKNIFAIIVEVIQDKSSITGTTLETEIDGEKELLAITDRPDKYINFLIGVYSKENDFIKYDLVNIITSEVSSIDTNNFVKTLKYISNNIEVKKDDKSDIFTPMITLSFRYLTSKNMDANLDINVLSVVRSLRGYWSSSKIVDKDVKKIKIKLNKIVAKGTGKKTGWMHTSIVIGIVLYSVLRSIAMKTYK